MANPGYFYSTLPQEGPLMPTGTAVAPPVAAPAPADPGLIERLKQNWADPNVRRAVALMGTQLMQPVAPGQSQIGHFGNAANYALQEFDRLSQQTRENERRDLGVETAQARTKEAQKRTALEERGLAIREEAADYEKNTGRNLSEQALRARIRASDASAAASGRSGVPVDLTWEEFFADNYPDYIELITGIGVPPTATQIKEATAQLRMAWAEATGNAAAAGGGGDPDLDKLRASYRHWITAKSKGGLGKSVEEANEAMKNTYGIENPETLLTGGDME